MFFPHIYLDFRPQVINIVRIGTHENKDFIHGMDMGADSAVPDTGLAVESPG